MLQMKTTGSSKEEYKLVISLTTANKECHSLIKHIQKIRNNVSQGLHLLWDTSGLHSGPYTVCHCLPQIFCELRTAMKNYASFVQSIPDVSFEAVFQLNL